MSASPPSMKAQRARSYLSGDSSDYLDNLYEAYLRNPESVPQEWVDYFKSLPTVGGRPTDVSHADIQEQFKTMAQRTVVPAPARAVAGQQAAVDQLVRAYRRYGHLAARLDPLGRVDPPGALELTPSYHGLTAADEAELFSSDGLLSQPATLSEIRKRLEAIYCGPIGFEIDHVTCRDEREWLRERIENEWPGYSPTPDEKKELLGHLIAAEGLEKHLGVKYVGQKRFSLEGGESFIPLVHYLTRQAGAQGVKEVVIGMAHRGRLNVMLNIVGLSPEELYKDFEGTREYGLTSGDVRYHLGHSANVQSSGGELHLSLAFNPSHLEFINPVVMGSVRARQHLRHDGAHNASVAITVHGDAALAGQGVVMESLSMSQTNAYNIGGTVRVVINNQVGFTTSEPSEARSSLYCTDIAKMVGAPVFHVNGDHPEAVLFLARLAMDYRMTFAKDVFVDLVCYRRWGHNEADEPAITQPTMYAVIRQHASVAARYAQQLENEGVLTAEDVHAMEQAYREALDHGAPVIDVLPGGISKESKSVWRQYIAGEWFTPADTHVSLKRLQALGKKLVSFPEGFELQRVVDMTVKGRAKMLAGEQLLDWGCAENLAYATLLDEGVPVRLVGEDCERATFGHRHAVMHDQKTNKKFAPLQHLGAGQAPFEVHNSLLSEAGALAFEYGYSTTDPHSLVLWEAQFGDFANGAQVIIDQFISSGWQKWQRLSGLVMLLPHGYEGMGPEHSSARLERFLQLYAQGNMQICVPSTPAQIFHLLRRQSLRHYRRPLIVMTPKSLLRHKLAVSALEDLTQGAFQLVIPEIDDLPVATVQRVVLCSGKVYYDLLEKRRALKQTNVAIMRVEQLYPFPYDALRAALAPYTQASEIVWCQEEPQNQGAWHSCRHCLQECLTDRQHLIYAGREPSAAPAAGYPKLHKQQQEALVNDALMVTN